MCSVVLRILLGLILISCTRFSLSVIGHSRPFHYQNKSHIGVLQPLHHRSDKGLGFCRFARRYLGNLVDLFSSPYLDVSVRAVPLTRFNKTFFRKFIWSVYFLQSKKGFPIRTPSDQSFVAAPRRLSRLCTSFIGDEKQGIHCLR